MLSSAHPRVTKEDHTAYSLYNSAPFDTSIGASGNEFDYYPRQPALDSYRNPEALDLNPDVYTEFDHAAVTIQATARGFMSRKSVLPILMTSNFAICRENAFSFVLSFK